MSVGFLELQRCESTSEQYIFLLETCSHIIAFLPFSVVELRHERSLYSTPFQRRKEADGTKQPEVNTRYGTGPSTRV